MSLFTDDIRTNTDAQVRVRRWIAALRWGGFPQAPHFLRSEAGFCCLGVACHLEDPGRWEPDGTLTWREKVYRWGDSLSVLPSRIRDLSDLQHVAGDITKV